MNTPSKKLNTPPKEKGGEATLPTFFRRKVNPALLSSVIVTLQKNQRGLVAHTRTRGEVRGGGRKPWRQKGTGRARHGSIRSPIWRGGGVTFGPRREKKYEGKINQKVKNQALSMALTLKHEAEELVVTEALVPVSSRTKEAISFLKKIAGGAQNILLIDEAPSPELVRGIANLSKVDAVSARNVTPLHVLTYRKIVISRSALSHLEKRLS